MQAIVDLEAYGKCVASVPRGGTGYSSNAFASPEQVGRWIAARHLWVLPGQGAVLFMRKDRDFFHLQHMATDDDALVSLLSRLPWGTYTSDLVGQGDGLDRACAAYAHAGFSHYSSLCRMVLLNGVNDQGREDRLFDRVEQATPADAAEIAQLLDRLLDPLAEQIPGLPELAQAAADEQILVVRHMGKIVGMLMFELKGQLAHLRFWHVDDNNRGTGIGGQLMAAFRHRCAKARRLVLWVLEDNSRSISIYNHLGFTRDGLTDKIMLLRKGQA